MSGEGFASLVLDVDSTLCDLEGIDWLAARCDEGVGREVAALTDRAMRGEIALESVYGRRLALTAPRREDIDALAEAYRESCAADAPEVISVLHAAGRRVVLVSGGLREAIMPLAGMIGIAPHDVHAVSVHFGRNGQYDGFDEASPLTTATGKRAVVESLGLPRRILAVGDGSTDLAMRPAVDAFAAFTGIVRREAVVRDADLTVDSLTALLALIIP